MSDTHSHAVDKSGTPRHRLLYAVFDAPREADQAQDALAAEGVHARRLEGQEAAGQLAEAQDANKRLTRLIKGLGDEDQEARRYASHLRAGRVVLVAPVTDQQMAERLTAIVTQHSGYDVTHFGDWAVHRMSPGEDAEHGVSGYVSAPTAHEVKEGDAPTTGDRLADAVEKLYP